MRVAVLVSGGGSNLQALIEARAAGAMPHARLVLMLSSKPGALALKRAEQAGIPAKVVSRAQFAQQPDFDAALLEELRRHRIDVVVLAGFLCVLGPTLLREYSDCILNIHPSLIPSFCGKGFYGLRVHEAALARGVCVSGATVHLVNEVVDGGRILAQKAVPVQKDDTPETLQRRVMEQAEWILLPQALEDYCAALLEKV